MNILEIKSHNELLDKIKNIKKSYLLLYKKGSEQSDCAYKSFEQASKKIKNIGLFSANVSNVKDIHKEYEINTVPSLLEFDKLEYKNTIKGCHGNEYYESVLEKAVYTVSANSEGKVTKNVIVYSTPTCTWCTRIKSYLRNNNIRYRDIDVSKNEQAAKEMVNRSGQQGVPQTLINGQLVIGFDKAKIDKLLDLKAK